MSNKKNDDDDEYRPEVEDGGGCAELWEAMHKARNEDEDDEDDDE